MAPPQQPNSEAAAFFEQIMGMDPNRFGATSRGVDHSGSDNTSSDNTSYPTFWPGFPFGRPPHPPPPPGPPGSDHPRPSSPPGPPGPPGHGSGPAPHPPPGPGHHGRHRHHHHPGAWGWGGRGGGGWAADDGDFYFSDDHHPGDYWGGRGYGRHGRHGRGRRHHHDSDEEGTRDRPVSVPDEEKNTRSSDDKKTNASGDDKNGSPDTVRDDVPDPDEMVPEYEEASNHRHHSEPFTGGFGGFGGFGRSCGGGRRGRGGRRGSHGRRHHHDHHDHHDRSGWSFDAAPGAGPNTNAFSFPDMMRGLMSHPFVQQMGAAAARGFNPDNNNTTENHDDVDSFSPPVDLFNTPRAYVLHVALPGAKREDVGVHWDPEHGTLSVTGVVHRPGDEAFLQALHSSERRVGVFSKKIALPPRDLAAREQQVKEDVDAEGIAAKLDHGVLVIMVPKVEKEWTEVRKVDIL